MNLKGYSCIKVPVHIMDIMKLRCLMLRKLLANHLTFLLVANEFDGTGTRLGFNLTTRQWRRSRLWAINDLTPSPLLISKMRTTRGKVFLLTLQAMLSDGILSSKGRRQGPKIARKKLRVDSDDEDVIE
jgi:hypothetical protein